MTEECAMYLYEGIQTMNKIIEKIEKKIPKWIRNKLEETRSVLECFFHQDKKYVLHLKQDQEQLEQSDKRNIKNRTGICPYPEDDRITESAEGT